MNFLHFLELMHIILPTKMSAAKNVKTFEPVDKNKKGNAHFYCGAGASLINISITFPVNKVMFRQQLYGIRTTHALHQLKSEGIIKLYRGKY